MTKLAMVIGKTPADGVVVTLTDNVDKIHGISYVEVEETFKYFVHGKLIEARVVPEWVLFRFTPLTNEEKNEFLSDMSVLKKLIDSKALTNNVRKRIRNAMKNIRKPREN